MLIVASDVHRAHDSVEIDNGELIRSYECPERADLIADALRAAGHEFVEPAPLDHGLLERVHTPEYLEFMAGVWDRWVARGQKAPAAMSFMWPTRGFSSIRPDDLVGQLGYHSFAADTSIVAGTWEAAMASAAIAVTAADRMLDDGVSTYGLCRPPGHHATADQFGGYCYVNNAAVAAQRLLDRGAERVGVLDVDYHHGNGTQSIFYDRDDVLFLSIHADPRQEFPWFSGHADERGQGVGDGWNINLPLPQGSSVDAWMSALDVALARLVEARVDAIVVSLGVDTFEDDPLGTFRLRADDFAASARKIQAMGLPLVVLQEGGYAIEAIGTNVAAFLDPLSD